MNIREAPPSTKLGLRRTLGTRLLVLYGLGVIVGAGIYVLIGTVMAVAGSGAPWSFVIAGAVAAVTGLSYAELAVRFPEAAGTPAYVREAFGSDLLARIAGFAVAALVVVSTASIARGCAAYAQVFFSLPGPVIAGSLVALATAAACFSVRESVGLAAAMTVVEIGGLLVLVAAGWPDVNAAVARLPELSPFAAPPSGLIAGATLAFFAYIGFENLANMAEEARDPARTLPRAILLSIAVSALLYATVAVVTVLAIPPDSAERSTTPLLDVAGRASWLPPKLFAAIAAIAVANGVLIELLMLGRLLYGMAQRGWLPNTMRAVGQRTRAPTRATVMGGVFVLAFTIALPFVSLVTLSSVISLLIFALVNGALWRLQTGSPAAGFRAPRICPPLGLAGTIALIAAQAFI